MQCQIVTSTLPTFFDFCEFSQSIRWRFLGEILSMSSLDSAQLEMEQREVEQLALEALVADVSYSSVLKFCCEQSEVIATAHRD